MEKPLLKETPPNLNLTERSRLEPVIDRVVGDCREPRERAVLIHRYLRDEIRFGFTPELDDARVLYTMGKGRGFCNTKGALFTAMLGMVHIPAQQHFVAVPKEILRGLMAEGLFSLLPERITHSFTEVFFDDEAPQRVDSYTVDLPLFRAAEARLTRENRDLGYGIVRGADPDWNADGDSLVQIPGPEVAPGDDFGSYVNAAEFYQTGRCTHTPGWLGRKLLGWFACDLINRDIQRLRDDAPGA